MRRADERDMMAHWNRFKRNRPTPPNPERPAVNLNPEREVSMSEKHAPDVTTELNNMFGDENEVRNEAWA